MSAPAKARLQEVLKLQSKIFHQTYNPTQVRTGTKYLTQKLKGDVVKKYYGPTSFLTMKNLKSMFPIFNFVDPQEEYRLEILRSYVSLVGFPIAMHFTNFATDVREEVKVPQLRLEKPQKIIKRRKNRAGIGGLCT